jgi:hypothetical protein
MTDHLLLIGKKLDHLSRMQAYLAYSLEQISKLMPIQSWASLTPEQHQILAAFWVRFSDFQEQLGKTMRAIAIEEEQKADTFTAVLLYMEKLDIIDAADQWKELRELRNAINHEYEEDPAKLAEFFSELVRATPQLFAWHENLTRFCKQNYASLSTNGTNGGTNDTNKKATSDHDELGNR